MPIDYWTIDTFLRITQFYLQISDILSVEVPQSFQPFLDQYHLVIPNQRALIFYLILPKVYPISCPKSRHCKYYNKSVSIIEATSWWAHQGINSYEDYPIFSSKPRSRACTDKYLTLIWSRKGLQIFLKAYPKFEIIWRINLNANWLFNNKYFFTRRINSTRR